MGFDTVMLNIVYSLSVMGSSSTTSVKQEINVLKQSGGHDHAETR